MSKFDDKNFAAFYGQMKNAQRRGVKWKLTFEEWLNIWKASGRLKNRGCRKGQYVMARFGDEGSYEVSNVLIMTASRNNSNANLARKRTRKNKANIAAGIKACWEQMTDEERIARGKAISNGRVKSGWDNPDRKTRQSKAMKRAWARLTPEQRVARGNAISRGKQHGSAIV